MKYSFLIEIDKTGNQCTVHAGQAGYSPDGSMAICKTVSSTVPSPSAQTLLGWYREYRYNFPEKFDGQGFVFLWLPGKSSAIFCSDRLGQIPVFYYEDDNRLIVSDHQEGILSCGIEADLNPSALMDFFSFFWVLEEQSFFKGIYRLPTGNIRINRQNHRYWNYEQTGSIHDPQEASQRLRETLEAGVINHLNHSKAKPAAHLSGGVDSSTISMLIRKNRSETLHTYGMKIEQGKDESPWIEEMSLAVGSIHTWVQPGYETILDAVGEIIHLLGEPMAFPSVISRYLLEREILQTDVFNGRGVDEFFSGYLWHLPPHLDGYNHMERRRVLKKDTIFKIFPDLKSTAKNHDPDSSYMAIYDRNTGDGKLERSLSFDVNVLLRYWLEIEYRVSSEFEHRCHMPVLDPEVILLAGLIDSSLKANRNETKIIFKQAFSDLLPENILNRPKMGLNMPFSALLKSSAGNPVESLIQSLPKQDFPEMDLTAISEKFKQHREGVINWGWQFWGILAYVSWKQRYILKD